MPTIIERQIDDWEKRSVIDAEIALTLRQDIGASLDGSGSADEGRSARRFSFFQVVSFFAAISFAAAVLLLIASNWELIPRLIRVAMIMALIVAGFAGGVFVNRRGGRRAVLLEEACYLIGAAGFVGGVALVAQMYHISGDERAAALTYSLALAFAGALVRSFVLVAIAVGWLTYWHMSGDHAANLLSLQFLVFALGMAAAWLFAAMTGAKWLRRVVQFAFVLGLMPFAWSVLVWVAETYASIPQGIRTGFWGGVWILAIIGLAAHKWESGWVDQISWLQRRRLGTFFISGLVACAFLHGELVGDGGFLIAASMTIVFVVFALYTHGHDHQTLRYVCYAIFIGEVLIVYGETAFSMLGTSGFFLALSVFLALIAFLVYRFEKRARADHKKEEEADA